MVRRKGGNKRANARASSGTSLSLFHPWISSLFHFHFHRVMNTPSPPPNRVLFPQSSSNSSPSLYSSLPRHDTYDNNTPSRTNDDIHLVPNRSLRCSNRGRVFISSHSPKKLSLPWSDGRHTSYASIETYTSDFTAVSESMLFKDKIFDATELYDQYSSPVSASLRVPSVSASPEQQKHHTFEKSFEASEWPKIILHIILCLVAYPILTIFVIIARNKTLFWSRLFVSVGCGAMGFALGLSLLSLARPFLEAVSAYQCLSFTQGYLPSFVT